MRLPVVAQISTKDGTGNRNARLTNCLKESKKTGDKAVVRPGLVLDAQASGVGNGLVVFNNELVSVYGDTLGIGVNPAEIGDWLEYSMGSLESWLSISWNGVIFCALGGGKAATSSDGLSWTLSGGLGPGYGAWAAPAWNGSVFCSVKDSSDDAATSSDGLTWSASTLPATHNWCSIAWNGSLFCAVAYDGRDYATSPNGVDWTARQLPIGMSPFQVVYGGSVLCVTTFQKAITSSDGITWTSITAIPAGGTSLAWNGSVFCATRGGTTAADISSDGVTWAAGSLPGVAFGYIAVSGDALCVTSGAGDIAYVSTDNGGTWVDTIAMPNPDGGTFQGIAGSSDRFVVVIEDSEYCAVALNENASIPAFATITGDHYDFVQSPI